jgi:hypothetical protein
MQVTPLKSYPTPGYPTREAREALPALRAALPLRWQGNSRVLTALALTCGLALPASRAAWAEDTAAPPAVTMPAEPGTASPTFIFSPHDYEPVTMGLISNVGPEALQPACFAIRYLGWTVNDILIVPLRLTAEHLGATVTRTVTQVRVQRNDTTIMLNLNSTNAVLDGKPLKLPLRVREHDGVVRVPLRVIVASLGGQVAWDAKAQSATVTAPGTAPLVFQCAHHFRAQAPAALPRTIAAAEVHDFLAWLKAEGIV